jgi:hypothetical protein
VFHSLNELKAEFPVVWSHDRTRNLYLLDIFGKKVKEHAERRAGRPLRYDAPEVLDARRRVEHALRAALVASPAWTFYEPKEANSAHFAVLAMHGPHRG